MDARFHNTAMVPVPSHSGFSVDALSFNLFDSIASEDESIGTKYTNDTFFRVNDVFDDDDDDLADASLVTSDSEDGDMSLGSIGPSHRLNPCLPHCVS